MTRDEFVQILEENKDYPFIIENKQKAGLHH